MFDPGGSPSAVRPDCGKMMVLQMQNHRLLWVKYSMRRIGLQLKNHEPFVIAGLFNCFTWKVESDKTVVPSDSVTCT